jgi:hypothetical protein
LGFLTFSTVTCLQTLVAIAVFGSKSSFSSVIYVLIFLSRVLQSVTDRYIKPDPQRQLYKNSHFLITAPGRPSADPAIHKSLPPAPFPANNPLPAVVLAKAEAIQESINPRSGNVTTFLWQPLQTSLGQNRDDCDSNP